MTDVDLRSLLDSWTLHLQGQRKSSQTVKSYVTGVRMFLDWCARTERVPVLERRAVNAFVVGLFDQGAEAATARARQLSLRRFSSWLAEEGELDSDPLLGMKPPKLDAKVVDVLTDDEITRLIKACAGKEFRDRRDEAIVRLMLVTGLRSEELLSMTVADTSLAGGSTVIRRGKGGKGRTVFFDPTTAAAVDRYMRLRRSHRLAGTSALWLGDRGKTLAYYGFWAALKARAAAAGLEDFHPHRLRHTAASRWLEKGGSEGGLMAMAGWSRRDMIDRYTKSTSERRAGEEAKRLNLGEF